MMILKIIVMLLVVELAALMKANHSKGGIVEWALIISAFLFVLLA